jgi:hypothetical protein
MKPVAGSGVRASLLGTIKRPDGKLQVTYAGKPLYLYSGDSKPGQANGQGVNQAWYAITPSGSVTTKPGTSKSTPSGSSKSSGTGSSSGTGGASTTTGTSGSGSGGSNGAGTTTSSSSNNAAICAADPMDCNNGVPIT